MCLWPHFEMNILLNFSGQSEDKTNKNDLMLMR